MKKITILVLIATMLLCLISCTELINTDTQEVDATVTDVYYKDAWTQMMWIGKVMVPIRHDAKYEVTFTYKNVTLTVDDEDIYNRYKDNIGTTVKCVLITKYYDDGTIRQELQLSEGVD